MTGKLARTIVLVAVGMRVLSAEPPNMEQTRAEFEKFAAQLPYLSAQSVLYDRPNHHFQVAD
jgi:hypothetical protein